MKHRAFYNTLDRTISLSGYNKKFQPEIHLFGKERDNFKPIKIFHKILSDCLSQKKQPGKG